MSDLDDLDAARAAAETIRKALRTAIEDTDRKLEPDIVTATGWGFGIRIDGADFVVCVEKV